MQKIYIAGPEVFLPNAIEIGQLLKEICLRYGFEGHFPLDNVISGSSPFQIALKIQEANRTMIRDCDILIANLSPFRGPEPDSGTVWEVGYAQGLHKKVIAYSTDRRSLKERTQAMLQLSHHSIDKEGFQIEDFGLSHNLMFANSIVATTFEACLHYLERQL